ncbi:hypothetical protein [Vibrio phage vB_VibM_83AMN]|nr:hypothetical protein [Vibrio phage vB_VibM_83AMN]
MSEFVYEATKTKELIASTMLADQGASFRQWSARVLPHIEDAYRGADAPFRTHLGASMIGRECAREIWYGFRWVKKPKFDGRMLRLFNRGHLEEGRFIALLLMIGMQVFQQDANGHQFRISEAGGHFGGSGDGIGVSCPDLPAGSYCLCEFKTHGEKSFNKLKSDGLRSSKPEHYIQMQIYMTKMGYQYGLYIAVNKNTDELECLIVVNDGVTGLEYINRGVDIIFTTQAPSKICKSATMFKCKFCDFKEICHYGADVEVNCRTCQYSNPHQDGTWRCNLNNDAVLLKEQQLVGCPNYQRWDEL